MKVTPRSDGARVRVRFAQVTTLLMSSTWLLLTLAAFLPARSLAQTETAPATGAIEGYVQNVVTGEYLNNARVSIRGTPQANFTNSSGYFKIEGLPAGPVTLRVFFTGLDEQTADITVTGGETVQHNFNLTSASRYGADSDTIKLDAFVVQATRETNAAAIAVNEQRVSTNIKSVVSTDAFGETAENNLGEFVKWLPGVGVEYFANDITGINVRGFGAQNTEITFNGLPSATAYTESNSRSFEMRQSSTADIARVEVRKVPLPSDSSNAIGGAVNLIRKTAFEQSRRRIDYSASMNTEDEEDFTFSRTPGVGDRLMRKWRPSWKLSITDPVVKNKFGYAFNYAHSDVIAPQHWSQPGWNYGSTNASRANPFMGSPLLHDAPIRTVRDSYSFTADWKPFPELTLSSNVSYFDSERTTRDTIRYQWTTGTARANDRYTTLGAINGGTVIYNTPLWRDDTNPKLDTSLSVVWKKAGWTIDAAGTISLAEHEFKDTENGFFNTSTFPLTGSRPENGVLVFNPANGTTNATNTLSALHAGITGVTVNFYDQTSYAPQRIEVIDRNNQVVDWGSAAAHTLRGARSRPSYSETQLYATYLKARRDFDFKIPVALEVGWQYQFEFRNRQRYDTNSWVFVGADGIAQTADDSARVIAADVLQARVDPQFGYPPIQQISMSKYYQLFKTNPEYFRFQAAESYRQNQQQPFQIAEETNALYLMGETSLINGRLGLVGGVRFEKTAAEGTGFFQSNASYQKYPNGKVMRAGDIVNPDGSITSRGAPLRIPGVTANSMEEAVMNYIRKGASGRGENTNYFPSLHLTYNITEDLIFRAAYAKTQAKVRFDRSTIPNTTITESSPSDLNPSLGNIAGRNPNLEPWTADNFDVRLEYYTKQGGVVAAGAFTKSIKDFQANPTVFLATQDIADELGFSDYVGYNLSTWQNVGSAKVSGIELEARQPLDVYLPNWARGFSVLASFGTNDLDGAASVTRVSNGDWSSLNKKRGTFYVNFQRGRLKFGAGYIYQGEIYQQPETLAGEQGERILMPRELIDLQVDYRLHKYVTLFAYVRNVTGESNLSIRQSPTSADHADVRSDNAHGANYTIGVRGTF
jgi:iron complex outermembrane recepter protein